MRKIRIGHIGTKHDHSEGKMQCVRKFPDVFEVAGIVENDPEQRAIAQQNPTYSGIPWMTEEELFNSNLDAVMIEGFEKDLPYDALKCVKHGLHVHVDKPAGCDLPVFKEVLTTAKQKGLTVQMAYMYRYNPAVQDCLRRIRSGELGEVNCITATMNTDHITPKRDWLNNFIGGDMFFLGCHMCDLVYLMQGAPKKITPFVAKSGFDGVTAPDVSMAVWEYDNGISTVQAHSTEIGAWTRRQLIVSGSRATYRIMPLEVPIQASLFTRVPAPHYAHQFEEMPLSIETVPGDCRYDEMMLDFARMVRGEAENPFDYNYEYELEKLVLASSGYDVDITKKETI